MRRLNVATFVNILIVSLVALTISLFVFGGRKPATLPVPSSTHFKGRNQQFFDKIIHPKEIFHIFCL